MTMPVFPPFAQFVLDGYEPKREKNALRTAFEDGYVKQDPVNSRRLTSTPIKYLLRSPAHKEAFDAWVEQDLRFGTYWFTWTNPETLNTTRARIREGEVKYLPLTKALQDWSVSFTIEFWS